MRRKKILEKSKTFTEYDMSKKFTSHNTQLLPNFINTLTQIIIYNTFWWMDKWEIKFLEMEFSNWYKDEVGKENLLNDKESLDVKISFV